MQITPIKTDTDYQKTTFRFEKKGITKLNTWYGNSLDISGILIKNYEGRHALVNMPKDILNR